MTSLREAELRRARARLEAALQLMAQAELALASAEGLVKIRQQKLIKAADTAHGIFRPIETAAWDPPLSAKEWRIVLDGIEKEMAHASAVSMIWGKGHVHL
jgi:hypothetical protein